MPSEAQKRREIRRRRLLENAEGRLDQISSVPRSVHGWPAVNLDNGQVGPKEQPKSVKDRLISTTGLRYHEDVYDFFAEAEEELPSYQLGNAHVIRPTLDAIPDTHLHIVYPYWLCLLGLFVRLSDKLYINFYSHYNLDIYYLNIDKIFFPFIIFETAFVGIGGHNIERSKTLCLMVLQRQDSQWLHGLVRICVFTVYMLKDLLFYFSAFVMVDALQSFWYLFQHVCSDVVVA